MKKVFTLFFSHQPVYGIIASSNFYQKDSITQSNLYRQYKSEFEQYEKQHGKYIQTNNTKMHYLEWGSTKNPTLIWIPGTYSNAYELYEIIEQLVQMNLHVIAVDYYGHGFTSIPKRMFPYMM